MTLFISVSSVWLVLRCLLVLFLVVQTNCCLSSIVWLVVLSWFVVVLLWWCFVACCLGFALRGVVWVSQLFVAFTICCVVFLL